MPTCSFCKKYYNFPRGLTVFLFDGKTLYFCSSKCKRNMALRRDPRKVNWVKKKKKMTKAKEKSEKKEKEPEKTGKKPEKEKEEPEKHAKKPEKQEK